MPHPLTSGTVSRVAVGFALIAALWLSLGAARDDVVALVALAAVYTAGRFARAIAGPDPPPDAAWSLVACGVLADCMVYAGLAAGAALHPDIAVVAGPAAGALRGTFVAGFGGVAVAGVWRLAVTAVILAVLVPMVDVCLHGEAPGTAVRRRYFGMPGDVRLPLAVIALLLGGVRFAFLTLIVLGVAALGITIIDGIRAGQQPADRRGFRGDGRLSVWIGGLVRGRLPPMPPLLVGLLVTGVLVALGIRNLPGILILTPVEAMLLAALGSWHPHDGPHDWLVPPLIQAAEYIFMSEVGFASHIWPPLTFAVVAAAGLRHLDLAYRVRGRLATGVDRTAFGWEGRMIISGIAGVFAIQIAAYPALVCYLWWRNARDWAVGWSARHAAVNG